jgi:hypothetical protein
MCPRFSAGNQSFPGKITFRVHKNGNKDRKSFMDFRFEDFYRFIGLWLVCFFA